MSLRQGFGTQAAPTRPALLYHGGKWKLAKWIIAHLPPHRIYVEPFGGAASVLLRKARSRAEVYNDLDGEVVNLFRVLRDPVQAGELRRRVELTPFARDEFKAAYRRCDRHPAAPPTPDADHTDEGCIECARQMIVRSYQGFGSAAMTRTHVTGFRKNSDRSGTTPAQDWRNWPAHVPAIVDRLRGVIIENKAAIDIITEHDRTDTLHYLDPPYPWSTRSSMTDRRKIGVKHAYRHEMTDADHVALAAFLHGDGSQGGGERDGGALGLSLRSLRPAALSELGALRNGRACGRRARSYRGAVAEPGGVGGASVGEAVVG
jgi:DNA adenine methylase